jgi:hypothetical protein
MLFSRPRVCSESLSGKIARTWKAKVIIAALLVLPMAFSSLLSLTSTATASVDSQGPGTWVYDKTCQNPGTSHIFLKGVSFDSSGGVWIVGAYYPPNQYLPQVVIFNEPISGGCTAYTPFTDPGYSSWLYGVTAVSPTDVWAVGLYGQYCGIFASAPSAPSAPNDNCFGQPLALHFVNGGWNVIPVQHVGGSENDLYAVGVDASNNVFAVGHYIDDPNGTHRYGLIEKYNPQHAAI